MMELSVKYLIHTMDRDTGILHYVPMSEAKIGENEDMGYSACWGLLIPSEAVDRFNNDFYTSVQLTFKAVDNGSEKDLPMRHVNNNLFAVDTPYGTFYFYIKMWPYDKTFQHKVKMAMVEPLDVIKLEEACLNHKFFFVGEK